MRKIDVYFNITSLDSNQEFNVVGEYKNKRIKFIDPDKNTNYIILKDTDFIEYYKKGNVDMKFLFKTNKLTKGLYTVFTNSFDFDILTDVIEISESSVHIKYRLVQNEEVINETVLNVEYYFLEEE